jgi:hypothetical protein
MDPGGSFVVSGAEPGWEKQPFMLLRLEDGDPVPVKPTFALPHMPRAISLGSRILASLDVTSQEAPVLRLHDGESDGTILRLGIDGGAHLPSATFDRLGRRIAWGQEDGVVYVCDIAEVYGRLGPLSDLPIAAPRNPEVSAVKSP